MYLDLLEALVEADADWAVEPVQHGAERIWIHVARRGADLPRQGWKLHVSADATSAERVLLACAEELIARGTTFKVAGSRDVLTFLNSAGGGASQIGKFITVYPSDDEACVDLAMALDARTRGLTGPPVPTDRAVRPGSIVSYRYGAFTGELDVQTPLGDVRPAVVGPDGQLIPDDRRLRFSSPAWAVDPFVARGLLAPPQRDGRLVAGRYVPLGELHRSASTVVELAVDLDEGSHCILKRVRRRVMVDSSGLDAAQRLVRERALLGHVRGHPNFPRVLNFLEHDDEAVLVMNDVGGVTIEERVTLAQRRGEFVDGQTARRWIISLMGALASLHDAGVVHRDLKPSNVMVDDDEVAVIDFDAARQLGDRSPASLVSAGTPGYMSPQQLRGEPADSMDDVFGLGGLLYYILTAAQPAQTPTAPSALSRPIARLNSRADRALAAIATRCLEPDASRRPPLTEVGRLLDTGAIPGYAEERDLDAHEHENATPDYRSIASALTDTLASMAVAAPVPGSVAWLTNHSSGRGLRSRDLGMGTAGALLAVAELADAFPDKPELMELTQRAAVWLQVAPGPGGATHAGLYVGESGIGAALLRAAQVLDDERLMTHVLERARSIAELPFASPDVYNGTAGRLQFQLLLYEATGDSAVLAAARRAASALDRSAEVTAGDGRCWRIPAGYADMSDQAFLGYAHGAAGVADALLDYTIVSGGDHLETVLRAAKWIESERVASLQDGAGLAWPIRPGLPPAGPFWCHGSAGVGQFFLSLEAAGLHHGAADTARGAMTSVREAGRSAGPTLCHGLAGSVEVLIDASAVLDMPSLLEDADTFGRLLLAFSRRDDGRLVWTGDNPKLVSPDLMVGMAGIATTLLRLAAPSSTPRLLSRAAYRPSHHSR